jgi:hypothetical protein
MNGKIRAEKSAKIASGAFFRIHNHRGVISLGIKIPGKSQDLPRAELDAKTAALASFRNDGNPAFGFLIRFCSMRRAHENIPPSSA